MHDTRTSAHRADVPRPTRQQRGQPPAAHSPAGPGAHLSTDQELLASFGDAIDDRITEVVDELLEERSSARSHRPGRYVIAVSLLLLAALGASALLRHSQIAWTGWPSAAVISIATAGPPASDDHDPSGPMSRATTRVVSRPRSRVAGGRDENSRP